MNVTDKRSFVIGIKGNEEQVFSQSQFDSIVTTFEQ